MLEGKRILVTGGTGSIGGAFVRRLLSGASGAPDRVIVLSRDEGKQYELRAGAPDGVRLELRIGDVSHLADVVAAVRDADIVVHVAAMKQVPACEYFPEQAVRTNCLGATAIVRAIRETPNRVKTVLVVSTDKACQPANVMGMTKALQERIFTSANVLLPETRFVCVRFGNVLATRGSVIPRFQEQIRRGGPLTVTDPGMTRFLLGQQEAVETILAALREAGPGEIYIPTSPAATVGNLATALIDGRDIEVRRIGTRPGERKHETLVSEEESLRTVRRGSYLAVLPMLPELRPSGVVEDPALEGEYSSKDHKVGLGETIALLERHDLLLLRRGSAP